jgi:hypothetical protein
VRLGEEIERIKMKREERRRNLWLREKDKGERGRLSVVGFALVLGGVSTCWCPSLVSVGITNPD